MKHIVAVILGLCIAPAVARAESGADFTTFWPQWRGPDATGVSRYGDPPVEWNENKNIRWKVEIPGRGHASPIVWKNRVFVSTAVPTDGDNIRFVVYAIDRLNGKILWKRTAREEYPHEGTHRDGSWASNSAVTDGEHVYAYFGSRGLYCYDLQGKLKWEKDLGNMSTRRGFGEGSSPVLYGDHIVINWDHEGQSFIVALDKKSGSERWKVERDERTSWSTPIVVEHDGKPQVIVSATSRTRSYDLATGKIVWECGGLTVNTIPSPVAANGVVYVTSGYRGNALQAIRLAGARGDITDSDAIIWSYDQDTPYVPSPLLYDDTLYFLKRNSGLLTCFNIQTGEAYYSRQRLEGIRGMYASPVGAKNRVYFAGRNGTTMVIKRGPEFKVLATNALDDGFDASPAIVDKEIYLRGQRYLYCIAED